MRSEQMQARTRASEFIKLYDRLKINRVRAMQILARSFTTSVSARYRSEKTRRRRTE